MIHLLVFVVFSLCTLAGMCEREDREQRPEIWD